MKITKQVKLLRTMGRYTLPMIIFCLGLSVNSSAQINYSYGWEPAGTGGWTSSADNSGGFSTSGVEPCSGATSMRAFVFANGGVSRLASADLGTNNNQGDVTLVYNYKVVESNFSTIGASASDVLLEVQYAPSSTGPWTTLQTIDSTNHTQSASCIAKTVTFTPNVGALYIRFVCTTLGSSTLLYYFDEVSLTQGQAPSCLAPSNISFSNITTSGANINFSAPATPPANGYDYYMSTSNTAPGNNVTGSSANAPISLSGLASGTVYYIWLRSKCSNTDWSAWGATGNFTTVCETANVPYVQQFESATPPAAPTCTNIQNAGLGNNWTTSASPDASGFNMAGGQILRYTYDFSNPNAANTWWYTQGINLTAGTNYFISYKYGATGYQENLKVAYGNAPDAASMTQPLADHVNFYTSPLINSAYFTPATTGVYYFGFNAYSNAYTDAIYLDSITVGLAPSCIPVTGNLTAGNITTTTANISFSPPFSSPAGGYDYYISTSNTAPDANTMITGTSASIPVALSNLAPATTYYTWVRSNCGNSDVSGWSSSVSFTTNIVNDNASGAIGLTVGAGCTGEPYTNISATRSTGEPFANCSGTAGYSIVWYRFTAPASGAVKISCDGTGGTIGNTKMALFSATDSSDYSTFNILACDNDNGVQITSRSLFYYSGLTPGTTYYINMDVVSNFSARGTFCLTVDEMNTSMLSSAVGDCQIGQPNNIATGYTGWSSIVDNMGNLVANIRGLANSGTQNYNAALTVKSGTLRSNNGIDYMNRNFLITGTNTTSADVQLFFTDAELTEMGGTINSLNVTKVSGADCAESFQDSTGTNTFLTQTANGSGNGVNYIQVNTPGFSNFYIMNGTTPLPITFEYFRGRKADKANRLEWKLNNTEPGVTLMALERSEDGRNFASIQEQKISSRGIRAFSYDDRSMKAATNHYRIRLTGENSKQSYSPVVTLMSANTGFELVNMVPNPVKHISSLQMAAAQNGKITIVVSDIAGRVLTKKVIDVQEGNNSIEMDFSYLQAGSYQLSVTDNTGVSKTLRFVKH